MNGIHVKNSLSTETKAYNEGVDEEAHSPLGRGVLVI